MLCHEYGVSALIPQMPFCRELKPVHVGVAKCQLFSHANLDLKIVTLLDPVP